MTFPSYAYCLLLISIGAAVGPEAQHVVHAGYGLHPAGCHFGRRRPDGRYPTSRDNPPPSGISQEVQETASQSHEGSHQVFLMFGLDTLSKRNHGICFVF